MKKRNRFSLLLAAVLVLAALAGCGSSASSDAGAVNLYETEDSVSGSEGWRSSTETAEYSADTVTEETSDASMTEAEQQAAEVETAEKKLIRNMDLYLETTGFDELQTVIEEKTEELGGYIEYSSVSGTADSGNRYSYMTVRIPTDQLDVFADTLGSSAQVLSKSISVQDVTLSYSDLEAHIASLRTEQETLTEMLAQADSIDTIIAIQNELTNVRYQLESYESQMKILENQISYSTVSIDIQEVKTATVQEDDGFLTRLKDTFSRSIHSLGTGITDFIIFFLGNILIILLAAGLAVCVILLIRAVVRRFKKGKGKTEKKKKDDSSEEEHTEL